MSNLPSFCCCGAGGPTVFATVLAYHSRPGFNSFVAPFFDKYLHRLEKTTITLPFSPDQIYTNEYAVDRLTGNITFIQTSALGFSPFPFASPPDSTTPGWEVSDTRFKNTQTFTVDFGVKVVTLEVTLSQPYTMAAMDADAQALLDSVPVAALDFEIPGTITPVSYDGFGGIPTDQATFNKDQYGHTIFDPNIEPNPHHFFPPSVFVKNSPNWGYSVEPVIVEPPPPGGVELYSVAGYVYLPNGLPTAENGFDVPCGYAKWQSYVKANTKFCKKYFFFDLNQQPVAQNPSCESGQSIITRPVKLTTAPLTGGAATPVIGTNLYVMFTPNCQCP